MKIKKSLFLIGCLFFYVSTSFGQGNWITDKEMQFKIQSPPDYRQNQMRDGSDQVLTLMSPDENVMIRVRAMPATEQFTPEILQKVFEENMLDGAQRILDENSQLNSIPAKSSAYTWSVDGNDAVLGIYYIVQQGFAYVVWTAVPRDLIQQRSAEADGILNTFTLIKPEAKSSGEGLLGGLGNMGGSISSNAGNPAPTTPSSSNKSTPSNSNYLSLVSDDACVEHFYPKGYKATSVEQGQSIWEDGSGVKMVVQTIIKTGNFRTYTSNNVSSISQQGADVVKQKYRMVNGMDVFQYFYTYGDTYFAYFAVENNDVYYLVGFVGDKLKQLKIVGYANDVIQSIMKAPCGSQPGANMNVVSAAGVKTATITHMGFDFSTGKEGYADGETIGWCPGGSHPNYSKGVWWRSSSDTKYKNMGKVSLNSVSAVPASWDKPAVPLLAGNVYVIKCADGYAAVKVLSADENGQNWPVKVEYKFTTGSNF